ncbi:oligosaccharide flippase family protein [Sporolactobacillus shoreicorticis]|uniref:Lipopolysaccharide biosynthesis protein n=1 Tax=Sporolactobacillus shoreicorticis TaxID=1923877 RepID=A0ABW5S372_9BACL|nr:oligosaccharide flippase family protein [Sporolactobacillus shoreicorticis]MCO7124184.1 oligosaccharide flippase family protein [Sporolactobacillus shoreicorticis]
MNNLIKKFLGFSIGPVIGAMISFVTIPVTTYFISPEDYGKAGMFTLFQALIGTFLYLGLDQAYTREYHETDNKDNLLKNAILFPLMLSLLMLIVLIFNIHRISSLLFDSPIYYFATVLFGISLIFLVFERFILLSIRMDEKALEYSTVNIFLKLNVLLLTLILLGIFKERNFLAVVYSNVWGQIIVDLYLIIRYRKYLDLRTFKLDKLQIKRLLSFGIPIILAASINNLLHSFDRIALRTWSNYFEIGIFTAALKISTVLTILQTSFSTFWTPVAYRWYSEKRNIVYFKFVSDVVLLLMSMLFCVILIFKNIIVVLLSADYLDAKYIFGLLCLFPIMYTLSETTTLGIVFSRKSYFNIFVSIISMIPNIIINILLTPHFGAIGAAVATGVSYIVFYYCRSYFSKMMWTGFSLKIHNIITAILFGASLINTQDYQFVTIINIGFLCCVLLFQMPTIKKIIYIYKNKNISKDKIL